MPEIVAAVGRHPHPSAALRWAASLTRHSGDDLVAVTVFDRPYAEMAPDQHDQLVAERDQRIHATVAETGARPATIEVLEGEPHSRLLSRVDRGDVEYVVVGQHDPIDFGGEDTAQYLIHHTDRPVVVISDDAEFGDGPVVVGVDGSPANAQALLVADRLAGQLGVELIAVYCPDAPGDGAGPRIRDELGGLLRSDVELVVQSGHPTETLAGIAAERDAALLVVGTRGSGGFRGLVAGRVATQLLRHSPVPLVVVPHAGSHEKSDGGDIRGEGAQR